MTHILSNLPSIYKNTIEYIEDKIDDKYNFLTIKSVCDKLSEKYIEINVQTETKKPKG